MGREIVYCFNCATRATEKDFERGKAFRSGHKVVCSKCAEELGIEAPATRPVARRTTSTRLKAAPPPREEEPEPESPSPGPDRKKILVLAGAGGGGLLLVVLLIVLIFSGGEDEEASSVPQNESARTEDIPPPAPAPMSRGEMVAKQALLKAQRYGKANPEDLAGRIRELEHVAFKYDGSASARDAQMELGGLRGLLNAQIKKALAGVEAEVEGLVADERFGRAMKQLEEAKSRRTETEWKLGLDRKIDDIRTSIRRMFPDLLDQAEQAAVKGDKETIRKITERVTKWEVEKRKAELEEVLESLVLEPPPKPAAKPAEAAKPKAPAPKKKATIPVDKPPTTAEGKAYRAAWEEALLRAAVRDHEGAVRRLEEARGAVKDGALKKEADADLKDLRAMQALWKKAIEVLATYSRGKSVTLDVRDGAGKVTPVAGRSFESGPDRIELKVEEKEQTVFVELGDVAGTSLPAILKADPRIAALVCLTEGEREAAKKVLGEKLASAPAKYWAYAEGAKARMERPNPDARRKTQNALALLYEAERAFRSIRTLGPAVEKYKRLLNDYSDVSEILRIINRIQRRSIVGKEYVFVARELKGKGTFKLVEHAEEGKAWVSEKDSDETMALYNILDVQFYALPELTYRLWARVGGCCKENFTFYYQATDLKVRDDEDRKKMLTVSPGGDMAMDVKHRIYNLKRSHRIHSKGPKTADRWEWVEIDLGEDPPPGFKHVRFITDQQGFGISAALISTTLKRAPSKAETKDLLAAREKEVPAEVFDPDLLGYWRLDEGEGARAADATGNGYDAELKKGAAWDDGAVGAALKLDGKDGVATVADEEAFRLAGDLTVAFWVKKDAESKAWSRLVGKGKGGLRNFGVWEEAGAGKKLLFQQYDKAGKSVLELKSKANLAVGKWTHVAAVIKGKKATLYVNGKLDGSLDRKGAPATTSDPLTFGQFPTYAAFPGSLDEIRIYRRALTADEIDALAGAR